MPSNAELNVQSAIIIIKSMQGEIEREYIAIRVIEFTFCENKIN